MRRKYIYAGVSVFAVFIVGVCMLAGSIYAQVKKPLLEEVTRSLMPHPPPPSKPITVEMKSIQPQSLVSFSGGVALEGKLTSPAGEKMPTFMSISIFKMYPNPTKSRKIVEKDLNVYYLNDSAWKLNDPEKPTDLKRQLMKMGKVDPDQTVILNIGPNAYQYKLIRILKVCRDAGLKDIIIVPDYSIKFQPHQ